MSLPENRSESREYAPSTAAEKFNEELRLQGVHWRLKLKEAKSEKLAHSATSLQRAGGMEGDIERRFLHEAELIEQDILGKAAKAAAQGENVNYHNLLKQHNARMEALVNQETLYLEIIGGNKISTAEEANLVMSTIDTITMEQIDLLQKLDEARRTGEISQVDVEIIADELRQNFMEKGHGSSVGLLMLTKLNPEHRMRLVRQMMKHPDKNPKPIHKFINDLVAGGYLLIDQAQQLFQEQIDLLKAEQEQAKGKKNKKRLDKEIEALEGHKAFVDSDQMHKVQEKVREVKKDQIHKMEHRRFGHTNFAKQLFSGKGMLSALAYANGALTVVGNALVAFPNPVNFIANPCTIFGVGLMGAGDLISNSFDGLVPVGLKDVLASATRDNNEVEANRIRGNIERMYRLTGNNPVQTEFYYRFSSLIVDAYKKKQRAGVRFSDIKITFEDIGRKYEELPAQFRVKSKKNLEDFMTTAVRGFMESYAGLNIDYATDQQAWIDEARKTRNVDTIAGPGEDIAPNKPA